MATEIIPVHGDITTLEADVVVNAANKKLSGGKGVDGAIHKAAGPQLMEECKKLGGCETGEAKMTYGYNLPARYIIHTVGPSYGQENGDEDELLANCYRSCLKLAEKIGAKIIAFPNISTGIYRYPKDEAVEIAINTIIKYLKDNPKNPFQKIYLVSYTKADHKLNKDYLDNIKI